MKKFEGIVRALLKSQKVFESSNPLDTVSFFQQVYDVPERRWIDLPTSFDCLMTVMQSLVNLRLIKNSLMDFEKSETKRTRSEILRAFTCNGCDGK